MELHSEPYYRKDLWWILYKVFTKVRLIGVRGHGKYLNVPCAFDIEVSSFYEDDEKRACMYIWMLGICGYCIIGRTWDELQETLDYIQNYLGLSKDIILPVYVHNLSYEFQFIKDRFKWEKVFAIDERKPNYALTETGYEFRCSYQLSGMGLAGVGKNLQKYKVKKLVGDLDYSKLRHSRTKLTDEELQYCINDVLVVMAYIQECMNIEGDITKIPNTKTGYVRREVKRNCLGYGRRKRKTVYRDFMKTLKLEPEEYMQLRRAFQGGFTHANVMYSGRTLKDVDSWDFTSSYPTVMISEQFPMSTSEIVEIHNRDELNDNLKDYCCLFDVTFLNIQPKEIYENYISRSKCRYILNEVVNNGRVVSADMLVTTVTDVDFMLIDRFYTWDKMKVENFRRYEKDFLPRSIINSVLSFYEKKTVLKDVEGQEVEYMRGKANLNSIYGMIVTDIIRDEITYDEEWISETPDLEKSIEKYNKSRSRFLFYPWGVWVTAYARRNLFTGIVECGTDYVYADTDSLKTKNGWKHEDYIRKYNEYITKRIELVMNHYDIPINRTRPKTKDGIEKPIGVWDYEGHYDIFKTLGAKRYLWQKGDKTELTVAGLGKKTALKYLIFAEGSRKNLFDKFDLDMYIPPEWTGKNIHTYIDYPTSGKFRDYNGVLGEYDELSSVHLEPTDYSLSISMEYLRYIQGIREDR